MLNKFILIPLLFICAGTAQAEDVPIENINDRIFMTVSVPKTEVYLGERVPLTVKLFIAQLPMRNVQYPKMDKDGFGTDNFSQPRQYSQVLNGMKYDVVDFKTFIYPGRAGDLAVGPVKIEGGLLYKAQGRRRSGGVFDDDFFNGFFDSYQERPVTVNSQALHLKVLDLPPEGKPANFTGAVGQLDFKASISPAEVKVGDPVTLRMAISGEGNLKSIPMPVFNSNAVKTYEPQIKVEGNAKTLEQVIIPTGEKIIEVPPLYFHYFDPIDGRYKTLRQGPFPLKVTAPAPGQEFKAVGFTNLPQNNAQIQQVDYVQKYIKGPLEKLMALGKQPKFWLMLFGAGLLWGLWVLWMRFKDRLAKDTAFARRLNASRHAREGLNSAQKYLNTGEAREFYNAVFKTLSHYLADKFHKPAGSLSWDQAQGLLEQSKIPPEQIKAVKDLFDACDAVRFAGGRTNARRMGEDMAKLQAVIAFL
ncbi:MAG: protein BatD, partial [Candidatus Omnitrophica bacterium]|nr:protein BatD [Candidatus Omnitrophota bacterium]